MEILGNASFLGRTVVRHRHLLVEMARRDLFDRYAGQALGGWWTLIHTVTLVGVYTVLFGVFFYPNLKSEAVVPVSQTMYILSGMLAWIGAAEVFVRAPGIIRDHAELTRQVVFPTEILPIKIVLAAIFTTTIGLGLVIAYGLATGQASIRSMPLLLPALLLLFVFLTGVSLFVSALGVFLKDFKEVMTLYGRLGVYIAPVFYFMEWLPPRWQPVLYVNPMTWFIEPFHDALAYGAVRHPGVWIGASVIALVTCIVGASTFARLKPQFGSFV